ncbi:MAG: glycosyltransferase, partial [Pseudomonadota bacterium]
MQLFVISMHRSGSSVASRLLNMLGAYFGAEGSSTAANEENPKGFWERRDIRALNDRLLFSVGCDWNRVATFDFDTIPAETLAEARREAQRIILDLDAHRPWVLKEPRFCLTLPLYRPFLEMPVAIVVHRDPIEVAMSLRHRNGLSLLEGVGLWEAYARSAWAATEGMPRIVIRHAEVMSDPVGAVNDLHDQLVAMGVTGLRRPSDAEITAFIDADLYRQRRKERDASGLLNGMQAELAAQFATGPADQAIDSKRSPGGQMALEHLELRLTAEADRAAAVEAAVAEERAKKPPPPEPTPVETLLENLESTLVDKMQSTLVEKMESRLDARLDAQQQAELDASAARDAKAEAVREEMDNVRQEMGRVHDGMGQVREEMGRVQDEMNGLSHDQQSELTQISSQLANILAQREYEQLEASLRAEANDAQLRATILQERMRTLLHFVDALWNGYQSLEGELSRRGATSHDAIELADDAARLVRSFQEDLAITQGTAAWRFGSRITDFIGRIARLPKSALHDRIVEHGAAADGLDRKRETVRQRLPERDDAGRMAVVRENRHLRPVYETVRASALAQLYGLQDRFVPETSLAVILLPPYGRKLLDALLGQLQLHAAYRGYELFIGESATEVAQKWARQLPIRLVPDDDTPNLATWINRCVALSEADVLCLMETRLRLFQDPLSPLVRAFAESGADYVGVAPLEESKEQVDRVSGIAARIGFDGSRGVALAPEPVDLAIAAEAAADLTPFATPLAVRREAFVRVGGLCTDYEAGDALEDFLLKLRFDEGLRGHLLTNLAITARGILKLERKAARDAAVLNARFGQRLRRHFFERLVDRPVSVVGRPFAVAFAVTDCDSAGDYLTARELGQALQEHHGWTVRYLPRDSWYDLEGFDVVVAMIDEFDPPSIEGCDAHLLRIAWARNWFDRLLEQPGSDDFDLFLSASVAGGRQANRRLGHRARTFRIATSDTRFATAQASGGRDIDYLFSGSNWGAERDITRNLRPADLPWQGVVLGRNWEEFEPFREIYRGFADYEELPNWYARTKIVIDDANHVTREWGSVNSRVYDALAAGALVLTNSQQSSDDVFDGMLPVYDSPESLAQLLDRFLNDEPQRLKLARRLRGIVLKRHTYARRAEEFQRFVTEHFAAPLRIGIKVPCPDRGERDDWGDTYFARTLARIFREQGLAARLDFLPEWRRPAAATDDVVLVLRGLSTYEPRPGQVNLMWNISHPDQVADDEYEAYDHVFVASASHAAALSERLDVAVSPLLQCTDATVFDQDTRTAG